MIAVIQNNDLLGGKLIHSGSIALLYAGLEATCLVPRDQRYLVVVPQHAILHKNYFALFLPDNARQFIHGILQHPVFSFGWLE